MSDLERQEKILREVKEFADTEIRPHASEFDINGALPRQLINKMAERGYLAASLPPQYGGLNLDQVYYGHFNEEIGKACNNTRGLITVHTSLVGETLARWGTQEQKDYWLPRMAKGETITAFGLTEPNVGTNARGVETSYKKEGDTFILNGRKKWISFGDIADMFLVVAANGSDVTTFLVERSFHGVKTWPIQGLLGGRASHIAEIEFKDVAVPAENVLGKEGSGFTYVVSTALDNGRYSIAWAGVALAQAAVEAMVTYSRKRSQFGQKLYNFQLIQGILGDSVTKTHAARSLCVKAGELRRDNDPNSVIETTIAKYFTSKVAMEVAIDCVQVHGGNGCYNEYPAERYFREAKILEIIEGTSQVQQEMISRYGLRAYYRP